MRYVIRNRMHFLHLRYFNYGFRTQLFTYTVVYKSVALTT